MTIMMIENSLIKKFMVLGKTNKIIQLSTGEDLLYT